MGASAEDEKTSSVADESANVHDEVTPTSRAQRWFKKTTDSLAHWGIETNGWVIS